MNCTVIITLLITLIFPYIYCFGMLWYSYIGRIATLAITTLVHDFQKIHTQFTMYNARSEKLFCIF